jgi:hypothetical protein
VIEFVQAKYRFAEPVDALAGIDSRPDLLKMDWYKFENLIRQLFEAMGLEVHVTQSSRDEGIDAVAKAHADCGRYGHCRRGAVMNKYSHRGGCVLSRPAGLLGRRHGKIPLITHAYSSDLVGRVAGPWGGWRPGRSGRSARNPVQ